MITKSLLIYDDTDIYEIIHVGVSIITIYCFDSVLQKQTKIHFIDLPENVQDQVTILINGESNE